MGFYDYSVEKPDGSVVSMKDYAGKVVLIVNTATGCGFTPHYKDIETMYEKYHEKGFEVIDVPCNQFAGQTPGTDEEVHEFCTLKYNTQFPQMKKSDVNGENAEDGDAAEESAAEEEDSSNAGIAAGIAGAAALSSAGIFLWVKRSKRSEVETNPLTMV